ncbi:MAG: transposase domain-containing protein [Burkholderiaceae bacterium]
MLLHQDLSDTHDYATPEHWGVAQKHLPHEWIDQALQATGVTTMRRRRLPMEQAVWLVLGWAWRGCAIARFCTPPKRSRLPCQPRASR